MLADDTEKNGDRRVAVIHTDSTYVCNGLTKWVPNWKKRDWMNSRREPVKNKDLWEKVYKIYLTCRELRPIKLQWVKGHAGDPANEAADELALQAAWGSRRGAITQ